MTDEDHRERHNFNRLLNGGKSSWEIDSDAIDHQEHPVFVQQAESDKFRSASCDAGRYQSLPDDFTPDVVYVELLEAHHGIPADYTLAQVAEFRLYWRETGEKCNAWQNKFKNHVIYQWKRSQSEKGQRTNRSTAEKLTDTSWADGLQIDFDGDELF